MNDEKLSKEALLIMRDAYTLSEHTAADYLYETTRTNKKAMTITELIKKVLADPNNVDWVLSEGYYCNLADENLAERFDCWKKRLTHHIEQEAAAIKRLNRIAAAAYAVGKLKPF